MSSSFDNLCDQLGADRGRVEAFAEVKLSQARKVSVDGVGSDLLVEQPSDEHEQLVVRQRGFEVGIQIFAAIM